MLFVTGRKQHWQMMHSYHCYWFAIHTQDGIALLKLRVVKPRALKLRAARHAPLAFPLTD